jgi:hypothetical protein
MKMLALLLLALPLAACAIPTPEQRAQLKETQLAQAEATCSAKNIAASDTHYLRCLNQFTRANYGMVVRPQNDGSLTLVDAQSFPNDPDMIGDSNLGVPFPGGR